MSTPTVTEVADGVHFVQSKAVNWTLLTDGDAFTLVDAGYPGDHDAVLSSIEQVGRTLDDLAAVLVTHAHVDHIGSLPKLLRGRDVPVLTSETETAMPIGTSSSRRPRCRSPPRRGGRACSAGRCTSCRPAA